MAESEPQTYTYHVGDTTFIVTPVYPEDAGETMFSILLKLMKADIDRV